jgi:hypothetical protein
VPKDRLRHRSKQNSCPPRTEKVQRGRSRFFSPASSATSFSPFRAKISSGAGSLAVARFIRMEKAARNCSQRRAISDARFSPTSETTEKWGYAPQPNAFLRTSAPLRGLKRRSPAGRMISSKNSTKRNGQKFPTEIVSLQAFFDVGKWKCSGGIRVSYLFLARWWECTFATYPYVDRPYNFRNCSWLTTRISTARLNDRVVTISFPGPEKP